MVQNRKGRGKMKKGATRNTPCWGQKRCRRFVTMEHRFTWSCQRDHFKSCRPQCVYLVNVKFTLERSDGPIVGVFVCAISARSEYFSIEQICSIAVLRRGLPGRHSIVPLWLSSLALSKRSVTFHTIYKKYSLFVIVKCSNST